jgi:hypothetical protein
VRLLDPGPWARREGRGRRGCSGLQAGVGVVGGSGGRGPLRRWAPAHLQRGVVRRQHREVALLGAQEHAVLARREGHLRPGVGVGGVRGRRRGVRGEGPVLRQSWDSTWAAACAGGADSRWPCRAAGPRADDLAPEPPSPRAPEPQPHLALVRNGVADERKLEAGAGGAGRVCHLVEHQPGVLLRAVHHVARHVRLAGLVGVGQQRQVAGLLGHQPVLVQLGGAQVVEVAGEVQAAGLAAPGAGRRAGWSAGHGRVGGGRAGGRAAGRAASRRRGCQRARCTSSGSPPGRRCPARS